MQFTTLTHNFDGGTRPHGHREGLAAITDQVGWQRPIFLVSFPVMAASIAAFAFVEGTWWWALFALIFGGTGSVAGTVAGLFVVEAHPQAEWDNRLSWFRLAYGAGQVLGLIIAAVAASYLTYGWILTAVLLLLAVIVARIKLPQLGPAKSAAVPAASGQTSGAKALLASLRSKYGVLLLTWFLTMAGVQTFFNVVPLVMRDSFNVTATVSSILFMVGAIAGTLLYPVCGKLAEQRGPGLVLFIGITMTAVSFGVMALVIAVNLPGKTIIGSVALVTAATAYAFEVVAATMLITQLTTQSQGSAIGLLNGIIAAGATLGAIAPAFVASALGYSALPALACGVMIAAMLVGLPLFRHKHVAH